METLVSTATLGASILSRLLGHHWGHVEPGETIERALLREVEEEIGVTPVQFAKLTSLHAEGIELHIYRVDAWTGCSPVPLNDEHAELRWFAVDAACALPNLASGEYIRVIRKLSAST